MNISKNNKSKNKEKGKKYENIAIDFLQKNNWDIIHKNFRYSNKGEIDIIAKKDNILYFFEVKYRKNIKYGHPFEAINNNKKEKLINAIKYFISIYYDYEPSWALQAITIYKENNELKIEIIDI